MASLTMAAMEHEKKIAPLGEILADFDCMRRAVTRTSKQLVAEAANAETAKGADATLRNALEVLPKTFLAECEAIEPLKLAIAKMSQLPRVRALCREHRFLVSS